MRLAHYRFGAVEVRADVRLPGYDRYLALVPAQRVAGDGMPGAAPEKAAQAQDLQQSPAPYVITVRRGPAEVPAGQRLARIRVRRGDVEIRAVDGGGLALLTEGLAPYSLPAGGGEEISWHLRGAPSPAEADHLIGSAVPWALAARRDTEVLHSATLVSPAGAVLLTGRSGRGKSTLSMALHQRLGWPLLGDDAAVLHLTGNEPRVLSCSREVRLWHDSGQLLGLGEGTVLTRYATKSRHAVAGDAHKPVTVTAVISLDPPAGDPDRAVPKGNLSGTQTAHAPDLAERPELTRTRSVDGVLMLRAGLMRTALLDVDLAAEEFRFLTRWARGVTFARLRYPHSPAALDTAVGLLADFAAGR
ncbi:MULTISPECIES: hypothetical protein [Pseudofrankia]|uniref:hypothetical protein n=1 Tax=Pseudofrankia TaxID=2994363 RepID=UPI00031D09D0|nr:MULTISPECIES: hypothetical protein [Pseudofrankia]OHV36069.1 hypothetical protein BCD49_21050 [Pseudofrankia sp. EUN1h]